MRRYMYFRRNNQIRAVVAYEEAGGEIRFAIARNNGKGNFSRKAIRQYAEDRLDTGQDVTTFPAPSKGGVVTKRSSILFRILEGKYPQDIHMAAWKSINAEI